MLLSEKNNKPIIYIKKENIHTVICFLGIKIKIANSKNNRLFSIKNGKKKVIKNKKGLNIEVKGKNNTILIEEPINFINVKILISGNNNFVEIKKSEEEIQDLAICMTGNLDNRKLIINKNFSCVSATITIGEDDSVFEIGEDCMFSAGIKIFRSDLHAIIDKSSNKIINKANSGKIGNHCWLGIDTILTKNASIANNTIIGAGAVVSKKFSENNIIIAGNPAKIIKQNIDWYRKSASLLERQKTDLDLLDV